MDISALILGKKALSEHRKLTKHYKQNRQQQLKTNEIKNYKN